MQSRIQTETLPNDSTGALNSAIEAGVAALPTSFTLSGTVSIAAPSSATRLPGASVEIIGGPHAGRTATADGAGAFSFAGLTGDATIRASLAGYVEQTLTAAMTQDRSLSFGRRPPQGDVDETLTGSISGGTPTCSDGVFTKPCVTFAIPIYYSGNISAELDWGFSGNDLDLTLWRGATLIASSKGVTRPENVSSSATGGQTYFIKVTYYQGSTIDSFSVRVRRPK